MARPDRYQPEAGAARGINFPAREQCSTRCRAASRQINAERFIANRFGLDSEEAYDVFARADTGTLKVVLNR
jgi:threonine dehydrogenase-like Zn-dependent dehydrogenase